jgi:cobalt-zinc-cadmium efflux system membrane fusion protein
MKAQNSRLNRELAPVLGIALTASLLIGGCKAKEEGDGAPPANPQVVQVADMNLITIDAKDAPKFPTVSAENIETVSALNATCTVTPDIAREVPVISLANGRVVEIKARLDDNVTKGQLLFSVQSQDVTNAFDAYLKAVNDEHLADKAYLRADDLLKHGAISEAMLEQAEDAEKDAKADLTAAEEQLKLLGIDKDHPTNIVDVHAPISGVVIGQNITNAAAAGVSLSGSATAFTIADLSTVWIVCDVHENDIPKIALGQEANIEVSAYPDRALAGQVSDIGPVLDPSIRTAKVRIEVRNPGILKLGMFVNAAFKSNKKEPHAVLPATAVLHLHDRDWVYLPAGGNQFKRAEVQAGEMLPGNRQVILSLLEQGKQVPFPSGQQVVNNALLLETAGTQ